MIPMKLNGIFAALTTPFDHTGEIYRVKIEHNLARWNQTNLAGYVIATAAGEGPLLTYEEKVILYELSAKHAKPGRTLLADVSVESVKEAAALATKAAAFNYHAVCARVPTFGNNEAAQSLFFRSLADRSPIPVIILEEQTWLDNDLASSSISALAQHPNIGGVVVSGNPVIGLESLLKTVRPGFQVLIGSAPDLWNALTDGAHGALLPFAAAAPYAAIAVWEAFRTREEEAGLDWQERIAAPSNLVTEIYGPAGLKFAMDLNGYYGGPPRLPLPPLKTEAREEIAKAFESFSGKT
jgi:4-hydroxy-2-oxoglutarate aldolase